MRIAEKSERTTREKGEFLMKHKTRTKALSWLLSLALALSLVPGLSLTALATNDTTTSYTITIPSTLNVANSGWNATDGISATGTLARGKKLTVTASSANSFKLKSGNNEVGYKLATASTDPTATTSWTFDSLSSTATTKPMGIIVEEYINKPAGEYTDTVTFTAEVENAVITVTWNNNDITGSGNGTTFTKDGVTVTAAMLDFNEKMFLKNGTFTTTLGNFTKIEVTAESFNNMGSGWTVSNKKATWTGTASSTVNFGGGGWMDGIQGMGNSVTMVFTIE